MREVTFRPTGQQFIFGTLEIANRPLFPTSQADAEYVRAEVSFYKNDSLALEVKPFEARWADEEWPRPGKSLSRSETTLRSTGAAGSIDFLVTQKHSPMHWWNNYSAHNLLDSERLLYYDDYFVCVQVFAHGIKAEQWLQLSRRKGQPIPTLATCERPRGL